MTYKKKVPTAFLDSSVIVQMLRGQHPSALLLDVSIQEKVRLAINPIVLQEIFSIAEIQRDPTLIDYIQDRLTILPVDFTRSAELLSRVSSTRNRIAHSNDFLILGSAAECDYLVTYDKGLSTVPLPKNLKIVTPDELLRDLGVSL